VKAGARKLAGLRRYHAERPAKTRLKLLEALDRLETGRTVVVGSGFKWSKTTLALEAGVNVNTVVRKLPGGQWAFAEINERFEELKCKRLRPAAGGDAREEKIAELRTEVERLKNQNRLLALEIDRLGRQAGRTHHAARQIELGDENPFAGPIAVRAEINSFAPLSALRLGTRSNRRDTNHQKKPRKLHDSASETADFATQTLDRTAASFRRVGPARLCERRPTIMRPVCKTPSKGPSRRMRRVPPVRRRANRELELVSPWRCHC